MTLGSMFDFQGCMFHSFVALINTSYNVTACFVHFPTSWDCIISNIWRFQLENSRTFMRNACIFYIRTAYIGEEWWWFLHFRYLKCLVIWDPPLFYKVVHVNFALPSYSPGLPFMKPSYWSQRKWKQSMALVGNYLHEIEWFIFWGVKCGQVCQSHWSYGILTNSWMVWKSRTLTEEHLGFSKKDKSQKTWSIPTQPSRHCDFCLVNDALPGLKSLSKMSTPDKVGPYQL